VTDAGPTNPFPVIMRSRRNRALAMGWVRTCLQQDLSQPSQKSFHNRLGSQYPHPTSSLPLTKSGNIQNFRRSLVIAYNNVYPKVVYITGKMNQGNNCQCWLLRQGRARDSFGEACQQKEPGCEFRGLWGRHCPQHTVRDSALQGTSRVS
jgi:hypothetical protein